MATENVRVVKIDTNPAQTSVKDLRNELKQLKDTMLSCEQGTDEYNKALTRAAQIQHDLKEQMEDINASAMDFGQIMGNVTNAVGGMVAGFQAVKATMSMLGIENEEVMKSLKNMQNLMALTQAFPNIEKGIKSLKKLVTVIDVATTSTKAYNTANKASSAASNAAAVSTTALGGAMQGEAASTNVATVATNTFKKALISTGIGAIVVLIGVLIANLDKLAKLFNKSAKEAEENAKRIRSLNYQLDWLNVSLNNYHNQLSKAKYFNKPELDAMDERIAKMQAEGKTQAQIIAQRQKDLERRKQIANEEIKEIQNAEKRIEKYFKRTEKMKISMDNVFETITDYQREIALNIQIIDRLKAGEEVKGYDTYDIENLEEKNKLYQANIEQLKTYISLHEDERGILQDIKDEELEINKAVKANAKEVEKEKKAYQKLYKDIEGMNDTQYQKDVNALKNTLNDKLQLIKDYQTKTIISEEQALQARNLLNKIYQRKLRDLENSFALNNITKKTVEEFSKTVSETNKNLDALTVNFNKSSKQFDRWFSQNQKNIKYFNDETANKLFGWLATQTAYIEEVDKRNRKYIRDMFNFIDLQIYSVNQKSAAAIATATQLAEEEKKKIKAAFDEGTYDADEYSIKITEVTDKTFKAIAQIENETNAELLKLYELADELNTKQFETMQLIADGISQAFNQSAELLSDLSDNPYWGKIASQIATIADEWTATMQKMKKGSLQWMQGFTSIFASGIGAAAALMDGLAEEQDKDSREGFETAKSLQLSSTIMNTFAGILSAWSSSMDLPFPWNLVVGTALSALIGTVGGIQVSKIGKTTFDTKSGDMSSSTATPSTSAMSSIIAPVQYTQDVQGAEIEGAIKNQKVYVTESDISDTQKKVRVSEGEATF